MTFKHKLSRRLAQSWRIAILALVTSLACESSALNDPSFQEDVEIVSISTSPSSAQLIPLAYQTFQARGVTPSGQTVNIPVVWTATGGDINDAGMYQAPSDSGDYRVVATHAVRSWLSDTSTVAVSMTDGGPGPVATVSLQPDSVHVTVGDSVRITAQLRDALGLPVTGTVTWNTSSSSVASVSDGWVLALSTGEANISATSSGVTGLAVIVVEDVAVAAVDIEPVTGTMFTGSQATYQATARDKNGNALAGRNISWSSTTTAVATVNQNGTVTAVTTGQTQIRASTGGRTGVATLNVTDVPAASVQVTPATANGVVGQTVQFNAIVRDDQGGALPGRVVTWSTSNASVATVTASGLVTGRGPGNVTVRASSEGEVGTASFTVSLEPVAEVVIDPTTATVAVGAQIAFSAWPLSSSGDTLANRTITWSSSNQSVATVSASGMVSAVGTGNASITAAADGRSATASVTVSTTPVASVTVSPTTLSLDIGETGTLNAVARDATGSPLAGRPFFWTTTDQTVATVNSQGMVTAVGEGQALISATSEGRTASATVTVTNQPVVSVDVTPGSASLSPGQTIQLAATPRGGGGSPLSGRTVTWTSSNPAIAAVNSSGLVTAAASGGATITATVEGQTGTSSIVVSAVPVAQVDVSPSDPTVTIGGTVQLTAITRDEDGAVLVGRTVTWTSANPSTATVNSSGRVTAVAVGNATIRATSEGVTGSTSVSVTSVAVASVSVSPASNSLDVGQTAQLTATPRDAGGNALTGRAVTWTSSNPSVATVSGNGLVTAQAAGNATITATSEGVNGTATVTVSQVPVASVSVSPSSPSITTGEAVQLTATTRDAGGNVLSGRPVSWSSSNNGVATVNQSGRVTGQGVGTATITATSEGVNGTASVTVTVVPVADVDVTPSSSSIAIDETVQLSATTRDAGGNVLSGRTVTWSSGNTGIATVNGNGLVTAQSTGTVTITATSEGVNGTATVTVTAVPVADVDVTPASSNITVGAIVQLSATTRDGNGNVLTGRSVSWSSSNTGIATVNQSGRVTGQGAGTATITATSEGVNGTATVTVSVVPVDDVDVTPASSNINVGAIVQLSATTRDAAGNVLTGRSISWSSSNNGIATVNQNGRVTGQGAGTATITATSEGVAGTATVVVTILPVAEVDVTPSSASVTEGQSVQLTATPRDVGGNALTGRIVTWNSSNASIASVTSSGRVDANAVGTVTITATSEGVQGSASITVTADGGFPTPNILNNESFETSWGPFSDGGSGNPGGQGQVFARRQNPPAGVPNGGGWAARLDFSPSGQDGGSNMTLDWVGEGLGPTTQNFWFRCYQYHTNSNNSILKNLRFMNNSGNLVGSLYSTSGFSWDFGIGSSPTSVPGFVLNQWMEIEIHYQITSNQRIAEFWINGVKSTRPDGAAGGDEGAYWSNGRLMVNQGGSAVRGVFLLNTLNGGNSRSGSIWLDRCAVSTAGRIGS